MRLLKKFAVILLGFILLLSFFFWLITSAVSPTIFKDFVTLKIKTYTQQPCEIEGNISWQLFPRPSIKIASIRIGNRELQSPYQIKLRQLFFNLKLSTLLQGKIIFDEIKITDLIADINSNYKPPLVKASNIASHSLLEKNIEEKFALERLLITNGKIRTRINNQLLTLNSLQLRLEQINLEQNLFPFQIKAHINYDLKQQPISAQLQFKGDANLAIDSLNQLETALKSTLLRGQLLIQNLKIGRFKINQIGANTSFKQATLSLNPLTLKFYQGEAIGDLNFNFLSKILKLNQTATGINAARLTLALFNQAFIKGKLDFSLHSQSNFINQDWLNTIMGNGNISLHDGTLAFFDLDSIVKKLSIKISNAQEKKEPKLDLDQESQDHLLHSKGPTSLKLMAIQYRLAQKMLFSDTLLLQTDMLQLKGKGEMNLTNYSLISHLLATLIVDDSNLNNIQELLGGGFPLIIHGTLTQPVILPDLKKINASLAKVWIRETFAKPVLKIKEQLVTFFYH
ncbi:putative asmA protein [Legionella busanensis]|uniref:Putative asmA protein n=1 Tax=Legionella busanensis TaxID=190655 RepID=A0A378JIW6_9GAMM|nr:AsmA family protein [Legionella busanensis]STX51246.1 putative asmA protein [Legionella busanensis]